MLTLFDPLATENDLERIIIYGAPGIGKSRFGLSLTERFGNVLYFAADDSSEFLRSISNEKKKRVFVMKPQGDDPISNFQEFCQHDWKQEEGKVLPDGRVFPKIGTIVVDTYTTVVQQVLQQTADEGLAGAEKHFRVGDKEKGGVTIPNRGDYRGTDSVSSGFITDLFRHQKHYHIVFICHEVLKYIEDVCVGGGPSHPGRRMLEELPGRFSTVIRLIRDKVEVHEPEYHIEDAVIAITENDGRWIAKTRTGNETGPNPIARVVLDRNPVTFWQKYDSIYAPQVQEAVNG